MSQEKYPHWSNVFAGKDEKAIWQVMPPPDLPSGEIAKFNNAQSDAAEAARQAEQAAALHDLEAGLAQSRRQLDREVVDQEDRPTQLATGPQDSGRAGAASPLPPLAIPSGPVDALLEKQIASCAGLIEHLAHYIARTDSAIDACANFMDRIASLMKSSANAAAIVGRLRGLQPEESRHRVIVQREGEGVLRA